MAQKAYIVDGLVQSKENDINQRIEDIPSALESLPIEDLRYDETADEVVDGNTKSNFFIDDNGVKNLQNYSPDAVEVTRSITLNRRGGPDDVIVATTGDFTTEFTVGKIINLDGSASSDGIPMKLKTVAALEMTIDETFNRITIDESTPFSATITQGWQRLEGLDFKDEMQLDSLGRWEAKGPAQLKREDFDKFEEALVSVVRQHVISQTPYPERHRNPPEAQFAGGKIVRSSTSFTWDDLVDDGVNFGADIYKQLTAQTTGVDITFDPVNDKIIRASGDFAVDGWKRGMNCRPSGSTSNNKVYAIKGVSALEMNVVTADADKLVAEGPASGITLDGLFEITAYSKWRNSDNPGEVAQIIWTRWMQEQVAQNWFDEVADLEKSWKGDADSANNWATSTAYALDDVVYDENTRKYYICTTAHTSGTTTLVDDIANWDEYKPEDISLPDYPTVQIAS